MGARRKQLQSNLNLANQELAITQPLVNKGVLPRLDLIRIQRQISDLDGELSTVRQAIPRLKTAAEEAEQRIEELILTKKAEVSQELNQVKAELKSVTETLLDPLPSELRRNCWSALIVRSSGDCECVTLATPCSMIGPSSRSAVA